MKAWWVAVILVLSLAHASAGPKATFEAMSYEAPRGWQVTKPVKQGDALTLMSVDKARGTFILARVFASVASAGSVESDFEAAWKAVVLSSFPDATKPQTVPVPSSNGWGGLAGVGAGTSDGTKARIMLVSLAGHGRTMSVLVVTNDPQAETPIDQFLTSVEMKALAPTTPDARAASAPSPAGTRTTTFDDGWTSTAERDWVRVTRPNTTVLLHFPIALDDRSRPDIPTYFWAALVAPRYTVTKVYPSARFDDATFPYHFIQGDAVDRATNRRVFVSLRINVMNGTAYPIEVVSESRAAFTQVFPDQAKLAAITGANRFGISAELLAGTWSSASYAAANKYYVSTGGFAGADTSSLAATFRFGPRNTFVGEFKGASSKASGPMTTFHETRKGTFAVAGWDITVKYTDGKVTTYSAFIEMTRGGEILRLQDKKYAGMNYAVTRETR